MLKKTATNLLKILFDNSIEFKKNLIRLLFDSPVDIDNFVFSTRNSFSTNESSIRKKVVPDILIYSDEYFAMIEVKVSASEGYKQTEEYYAHSKAIKSSLNISTCKEEKYYFLTKYGSPCSSEKFKPLSWSKINECLPNQINGDAMLDAIVQQLRRRLSSLTDGTVDRKKSWNSEIKPYLFSGAAKLHSALSLIPELKDMASCSDYWDSFDNSNNTYYYSAMFEKQGWLGKPIDEIDEKSIRECFDFHFEFKWDDSEKKLVVRLDYHLNPYFSTKEINNTTDEHKRDMIRACNEFRATIAQKCKKDWKETSGGTYRKYYNGHITNNLMMLVTFPEIQVKENDSVDDVLKKIQPMIQIGIDFIDNYVLPNHRNNINIDE